MSWNTLSYWKRGGLIGAFLGLIGFIISLAVTMKLLIFDGWDGISDTAGSSLGNILGWVFIYGVLAVTASGVIGIGLLLIFSVVGSCAGWLYGKTRRPLP